MKIKYLVIQEGEISFLSAKRNDNLITIDVSLPSDCKGIEQLLGGDEDTEKVIPHAKEFVKNHFQELLQKGESLDFPKESGNTITFMVLSGD